MNLKYAVFSQPQISSFFPKSIPTHLFAHIPELVLSYVHTKPDKFENATFAAKPDKMFSVHINRFQTGSKISPYCATAHARLVVRMKFRT